MDSNHLTLVTSCTSNRSDWLSSECVNIFDGEIYRLALEQTPMLDKLIPRTYGHVLRKGMLGVQDPVFINLLEHLFFFG